MLGFNTDGEATGLEAFALIAGNRNNQGNKAQNQHHDPDPK